MSVQRWDMDPCHRESVMAVNTHGKYVLYDDHARIVAEMGQALDVRDDEREDAAWNRGYARGLSAAEQAHAAALAEAVDEGRKFVLAIWDDGYSVEQRMAAAFRKGQETAAPRTLTADDRNKVLYEALAAVWHENECNCAGVPDEDGGSTHTGDCSLTRNLAAIRALIHDGEDRYSRLGREASETMTAMDARRAAIHDGEATPLRYVCNNPDHRACTGCDVDGEATT